MSPTRGQYVTHSRTLHDGTIFHCFSTELLAYLETLVAFCPYYRAQCRRPSSHSHRPHRQVLLLCPREILRHTVQQAPWVSDRAFDRVVRQVSTSCGRFQSACAFKLEASRLLQRVRQREPQRAPPRGRLNPGRALTDRHSPAMK
jgi:hypothetical protein